MKLPLPYRFQVSLDHHLGDSVGHRRNPERTRLSRITLGNVNPTHGWRKVAAGTHPISDSIEIVTQLPLEIFDGLSVNSRRASVRLHLLVRFPHFTLRNTKRLGSIHADPPSRVVHWIKPDDDAPSVQSHYRTFFPTTDVSAPVPRIGTQTLTAASRLGFSLRIGTTGSCVPYRSLSQGQAAFMPDAGWAVGRHLPTLARGIEVRIPVSTSPGMLRHVISDLLSFVSSRPT
jgi:hypothetical protein